MPLMTLTRSCLYLGVDPKTLRRWLHAAGICPCPHPQDRRLHCLTLSQLEQLALLHERPLSASPAQAPAAASAAESLPPSSAQEPQLRLLREQVASLQAQVTELAFVLLHRPSDPSGPAPDRTSGSLPSPQPRSKRSGALPLVQVHPDGRVLLVTASEGILSLVPDSPAWFAWLAGLSAFTFECPSGHFSAAHLRRHGHWAQCWNARRSLHGHDCSLYLGLTPTLTLAHLQQCAATIQDRLTAL